MMEIKQILHPTVPPPHLLEQVKNKTWPVSIYIGTWYTQIRRIIIYTIRLFTIRMYTIRQLI